MALQIQFVIAYFVAYNIVGSFGQSCLSNNTDPQDQVENKFTCSTDDLNHSTLVECKISDCDGVGSQEAQIWPASRNSIIHMYSTRSGDRFAIEKVKNINYTETDEQKWYDINTTFYVDTKKTKQEILGFGTTFDPSELLIDHLNEENFSIIRDLFAKDQSGIHYSILVVPVTTNDLLNGQVLKLLNVIDGALLKKHIGHINIILKLESASVTDTKLAEHLRALAESFKSFSKLECWAVVVSQENIVENNNLSLLDDIGAIFSPKHVFVSSTIGQLPDLIDRNSSHRLKGLLIKSKFSTPYNILNHARQSNNNMILFTIGDDKPRIVEHGDWQNAQHYAVEILKHLENGSNGFAEALSVSEVLADSVSRDSSIYSLHLSHMLHFRGPMFYAIGHFSRHVVPGSKRLSTNLFTQPNMFAAHYQAFLTPQNHVVAIVLNDNEHLLPFRLAVDDRILTNIQLKPKSFNTIVLYA